MSNLSCTILMFPENNHVKVRINNINNINNNGSKNIIGQELTFYDQDEYWKLYISLSVLRKPDLDENDNATFVITNGDFCETISKMVSNIFFDKDPEKTKLNLVREAVHCAEKVKANEKWSENYMLTFWYTDSKLSNEEGSERFTSFEALDKNNVVYGLEPNPALFELVSGVNIQELLSLDRIELKCVVKNVKVYDAVVKYNTGELDAKTMFDKIREALEPEEESAKMPMLHGKRVTKDDGTCIQIEIFEDDKYRNKLVSMPYPDSDIMNKAIKKHTISIIKPSDSGIKKEEFVILNKEFYDAVMTLVFSHIFRDL